MLPTRPTDLPFTIGNDICRIVRVGRILKGRLGPQFVRRILKPNEIGHPTTAGILQCILDQKVQGSEDAQTIPATSEATPSALTRDTHSFTRAVEFMAGRFAAKEAVIKAHPYRRLTFHSITILRATFHMNSREGSALDMFEQMGNSRINVEEETKESRARLETTPPQSGPLVAMIQNDAVYPQTFASVSISHDTDYATAVCLGINLKPDPS
ncbi:hypothetical protein F5Y12DRAFT_716437 [Xylaria sp. FL1777]|nr:hypothetical protein F5Y12DRAFT_716437 [Xylaria sp. FL1777]